MDLNYSLSVVFFILVIILTLGITYWASKRNVSASSHYVAGGNLTGWQNGLAISGDFISAGAFLGVTGAIALGGFDAVYLGIGGLVAFAIVLLLVAEPLRNLGKYTVADALRTRFDARGVRSSAALNTIFISAIYMVANLVGAGAVIQLLLGIPFSISVLCIGALITIYVVAGGMLATTWIQIVQGVLMILGAMILALIVLASFNFNPVALFGEVQTSLGREAIVPSAPSAVSGLDSISLNLALLFGVAGLPHILIRFFTVPDAKTARNSVVVNAWVIGVFYAFLPIISYGAAVIVGRETIISQGEGGNSTVLLLASNLLGPIFLAFISGVAFVAILATVSGVAIAASGAFAHDIYTNLIRSGEASEREQARAARWASLGVTLGATLLALSVQNFNIAFLAALAFAVAASTNVPVILLTLFWERFNKTGAIIGMLGGLISSVGLILIGPNVMAAPIFPLANPGIVSIPIGLLACVLGTYLGGKSAQKERQEGTQKSYQQLYVEANVGVAASDERS